MSKILMKNGVVEVDVRRVTSFDRILILKVLVNGRKSSIIS